jgi:DNA-binding transcriptional regulator YiaG
MKFMRDESYVGHCPACGSTSVTERWQTESFPYGDGDMPAVLDATVPVSHCRSCQFEFTDERAEHIRHAAVCRHLELLSPDEVLAIRERYQMSQQEFAAMCRIGRASLARCEAGSLFQNASNDSLLFLLSFPENVERLIGRREVMNTTVRARSYRFRAIAEQDTAVLRREASTFSLYAH